jgi:actin
VRFPCIVGRVRRNYTHTLPHQVSWQRTSWVGDDAQSHRGIMSLEHPMERGIVRDWQALEQILRHTFYSELRSAPEEHPILLSTSVLSPANQEDKMKELIFEKFCCTAAAFQPQPVLTMYAHARSHGRYSGLFVESGADLTQVVPIYEGYVIHSAVRKLELAGRDIDCQLQRLLTERGHYLNRSTEREMCRDMKEKLAYVALDFETELKAASSQNNDRVYELADGKCVSLGSERFRCTEPLFQPSLIGMEAPGLDELVFESMSACPKDVAGVLRRNVCLGGQNTLLSGLKARLERDLQARFAFRNASSCVVHATNHRDTAWAGGSVLAGLVDFARICQSKRDYDERGTRRVAT